MKAARFPAYKDLSGFNFAASEINEATVRQLHRCEFLDGAQNIVLIRCLAGYCEAMHEKGWPRHGQNSCRDSPWRAGRRTLSPKGPLLLDHRARQHTRTGEGQGQSRTACRKSHPS